MTKGSETSSVRSVDWRTEKPLTKDSESSSAEPVLHVRRVTAQSPSCNDGSGGHREVFATESDRKVQGQKHVISAERHGDCKVEALTASMFPDDLMDRGTPVLIVVSYSRFAWT